MCYIFFFRFCSPDFIPRPFAACFFVFSPCLRVGVAAVSVDACSLIRPPVPTQTCATKDTSLLSLEQARYPYLCYAGISEMEEIAILLGTLGLLITFSYVLCVSGVFLSSLV